nr:ribonuclease H-like domain-containing protein [Tanacetum cinerariifolium]
PRNNVRKLHERFGKIYKWSYIKFTPLGYMWKPKSPKENVNPNLIEIVLFIVDSGCSKHMTRNLKLLINFVEKFLETVKFGNDQIAPILGYGDPNGVVERRNRTLVEAARTIDGENLDKMKEKGDECIFVGYSTQSRAYRVFNKRTRVIMESIHVNFDELPQQASAQNSTDPALTRQTKALVQNSTDPALTRQKMASVQNSTDPGPTCQEKASVQISSDPAPKCQTMALEHNSLSPGRNCQENVSKGDKTENVSHGDKTVTTSNELDFLFSPMFDELLNGSSKVVYKSFAVSAADAPNQR